MRKSWINNGTIILAAFAFILYFKAGQKDVVHGAQGFFIEDHQLENGVIQSFHIFFDSQGRPLVLVPSDLLAGALYVLDNKLI